MAADLQRQSVAPDLVLAIIDFQTESIAETIQITSRLPRRCSPSNDEKLRVFSIHCVEIGVVEQLSKRISDGLSGVFRCLDFDQHPSICCCQYKVPEIPLGLHCAFAVLPLKSLLDFFFHLGFSAIYFHETSSAFVNNGVCRWCLLPWCSLGALTPLLQQGGTARIIAYRLNLRIRSPGMAATGLRYILSESGRNRIFATE